VGQGAVRAAVVVAVGELVDQGFNAFGLAERSGHIIDAEVTARGPYVKTRASWCGDTCGTAHPTAASPRLALGNRGTRLAVRLPVLDGPAADAGFRTLIS